MRGEMRVFALRSYTHVNIKNKIDKYIMWTIFEKVVEARAIYMERGSSGKQSRNRKES